MGYKKILGIVFQLPAMLILVGGLIVSVYAYFKGILDLSIFTPIFVLISIILYIVGRWFMIEEEDNYVQT